MIVEDEPFLIEYNVRMGDPECQTILPKLESDFLEIIDACVNRKLEKINFEWKKEKSICVVLCSKGYPENYKKNSLAPASSTNGPSLNRKRKTRKK